LPAIRARFWLVGTDAIDVVGATAIRADMAVEATLRSGWASSPVPLQAWVVWSLGGSSSCTRLRLQPRVSSPDIQVLDAQVSKLGQVCE
jgi:hypothetical protein